MNDELGTGIMVVFVSADCFQNADTAGDLGGAVFCIDAGLFDGAGEEADHRVQVTEHSAGEARGDVATRGYLLHQVLETIPQRYELRLMGTGRFGHLRERRGAWKLKRGCKLGDGHAPPRLQRCDSQPCRLLELRARFERLEVKRLHRRLLLVELANELLVFGDEMRKNDFQVTELPHGCSRCWRVDSSAAPVWPLPSARRADGFGSGGRCSAPVAVRRRGPCGRPG